MFNGFVYGFWRWKKQNKTNMPSTRNVSSDSLFTLSFDENFSLETKGVLDLYIQPDGVAETKSKESSKVITIPIFKQIYQLRRQIRIVLQTKIILVITRTNLIKRNVVKNEHKLDNQMDISLETERTVEDMESKNSGDNQTYCSSLIPTQITFDD